MNEATFDALIASIYVAATDAARWGDLLRNLETAFHGSGCALLSWDRRSNAVRVISTRDDAAEEYVRDWNDRNPLREGNAILPTGVVASDAALMPRERLHRTDYFNRFLLAQDIPQLLALKLWNTERADTVLNIMRGRGRPDWDESDLVAGRRLMPHFQAAVALATRLAETSTSQGAAGLVIDRLPSAVLLLDQDGRALNLNPAATLLLARRDGLALGAEGLGAALPDENARLQRLVGLATRGDAHARRHGGALAVSRPSGQRSFALLLAPLDAEFNPLVSRRPSALVTITDPEVDATPPAEHLRALYGLTPSESALALGVAAGQELRDVAERLGLTVLSARQYLTRIFHKTDTRRQHELARLLAVLGAAAR